MQAWLLDPDGGDGPPWLAEPDWLRAGYDRTGDLLHVDKRSYQWIISAILAVSRTFFEELGGFDATIVGYCAEDWELAYRASCAGAILAHRRSAVGIHDGGDWRLLGPEALKNDERMSLARRVPGLWDPLIGPFAPVVVFLPATAGEPPLDGHRVPDHGLDKTREEVEKGFWGKLVNRVMKRPIAFAAPIIIVMILLIIPLGQLALGGISEKYLPPDNSVRQAQEEFDKTFPGFRTEPLTLVIESNNGKPVTDQQIAEVRNKAMQIPGFIDARQRPVEDVAGAPLPRRRVQGSVGPGDPERPGEPQRRREEDRGTARHTGRRAASPCPSAARPRWSRTASTACSPSCR